MTLTQDQIDFFFENGYLRYSTVLDPAGLELLRSAYDAEFRSAWENNAYNNLSTATAKTSEEKRRASQQMYQIMQMCERNIHFRRMLFNKKILDVVEDLMGPNIMLFHDQALFKPAKSGGPVPWHQDNSYWKCIPATLISCWIALDDAFRENGAMQVIPGTHLHPSRHAAAGKETVLLETKVDESKAVVVDLKAGECMFHHCQTLHYTQPNSTDQQRRAFILHFMLPGTRGADGQIMKVSFARPMLRMSI